MPDYDERLRERSAAAYGIAAERTHDPSLIDDVAQEVLIEMWKQLQRAERGASSDQAVLNKAGKRRAYRVATRDAAWTGQPRRVKGGEHSAPASASLDALAEAESSDEWWVPISPDQPEEAVLARMEWERMKDRIMHLAPEHREAIILSLQGLNSVEIAEKVGVTRQGVDKRLHRARELLRVA